MALNRREFVVAAAAAATLSRPSLAYGSSHAGSMPGAATPFPLTAVRLLPSPYATAVQVNLQYLLSLSADRLLHNFLLYAGLKPKAPIYGGWESDTLAGHTAGHYMTALVQVYQQTGDMQCRDRANYMVSELARAQAARGNGYVGALGKRKKDGTIVDGIEIFEEVRRGTIQSGGFDLNGGWSPLYVVHKVMAGLLDVHEGCNNAQALQVTTGLATYFANLFDTLNDEQMQKLLACEYGGLNESYAELYAVTKNKRWILTAQRIYDHRVLDPLEAGQDKLANFHANTQVPKLIGLARIHELTGDAPTARAAGFFWTTVTQHHSYVIGGNADREYFSEPNTISQHITEQTCEHCNTYNMLKLTRHLFSWKPDGALFDYYERAHLNHVMAAQDPATSGFTYMTPLMTAAERDYSSPKEDAFWCCVGTGMESHAKHGESIFWQGDNGALLVNLYIPAQLTWAGRKAVVRLETEYPYRPDVTLTFTSLHGHDTFPLCLRIPAWANGPVSVQVNGKPVPFKAAAGYAVIERAWRQHDVVALQLPLTVRMEVAPGDQKTVAFLRGPMVLAGDLGPVETPWTGNDPAMVGDDLSTALQPVDVNKGIYKSQGTVRPADLTFVPFFTQYRRRSAVYFQRFTEADWKTEEASYAAEQARQRDIAARSTDVMHLGEMQPERDHKLISELSYPLTYRGRQGRDARSGGYFEFTLKSKPGPLMLQATYWGSEHGHIFDILVNDQKIATETLNDNHPGKFFDVEYPLPEPLTRSSQTLRVRFLPHDRSTAGPVFGVRLFTATQNATS